MELAEDHGLLQLELDARVRAIGLLLYTDLAQARGLLEESMERAVHAARWRSVTQLLALKANLEGAEGRMDRAVDLYRGLLPVLRNTGGRRAYYAMTGECALLLTCVDGPSQGMRMLDGALLDARSEASEYGITYLQACRGAVYAHDQALEMARWAWCEARAGGNELVREFVAFEQCFFERAAGLASPLPEPRTQLGRKKRRFLQRKGDDPTSWPLQAAHLHRWRAYSPS
jgi:hypothetical protein